MSGPTYNTSRRIACPTCGAQVNEYCTVAGVQHARSHPARARAAETLGSLTTHMLRTLRKIATDGTVHIDPSTRISLRNRGLIVAIDGPRSPSPSRRAHLPPRRHQLTEAGRAAIGVASATGPTTTNQEASHG